jgi:serine/threonine protein kinase
MGIVYEAFDRAQSVRVALKVLPKVDARALYRFKQEFRSLVEVVHPNLVPLYELISEDGTWFFTMELIDGVDFRSCLRQEHNVAGAEHKAQAPSLDYDKLRRLLSQLAEGVCALHHAGKLHRDIKPSNVLVRRDDRVVLLDYGLVSELGSNSTTYDSGPGSSRRSGGPWSHLTVDQHFAGTALYMSPEQAAGSALTEATDWYAMGALLYESLTGQAPFTGAPTDVIKLKQQCDPQPPVELVDGIPEDLSSLCVDLLHRDPLKRPTGVEVLARLHHGVSTGRPALELRAAEHSIPFVGRRQHRATLNRAFNDVVDGNAVTLHVYGPSGAGKSVLEQFHSTCSGYPAWR